MSYPWATWNTPALSGPRSGTCNQSKPADDFPHHLRAPAPGQDLSLARGVQPDAGKQELRIICTPSSSTLYWRPDGNALAPSLELVVLEEFLSEGIGFGVRDTWEDQQERDGTL